MKKKARFICVNSSNNSIFEDEDGNTYSYAGQFLIRNKGDVATIFINEFDRIDSVQFHTNTKEI